MEAKLIPKRIVILYLSHSPHLTVRGGEEFRIEGEQNHYPNRDMVSSVRLSRVKSKPLGSALLLGVRGRGGIVGCSRRIRLGDSFGGLLQKLLRFHPCLSGRIRNNNK